MSDKRKHLFEAIQEYVCPCDSPDDFHDNDDDDYYRCVVCDNFYLCKALKEMNKERR